MWRKVIARRGEQRAVAADHDREISLAADRRVVESVLANVGGSFFLDERFAAALFEIREELAQRRRNLRSAELADKGNLAEGGVGHLQASVQ